MNTEEDGLQPIEEPVGKFILDNLPLENRFQTANGLYIHYTHVCGLLKKYDRRFKTVEPGIKQCKIDNSGIAAFHCDCVDKCAVKPDTVEPECEHDETPRQGDGFTYFVCSKCGASV